MALQARPHVRLFTRLLLSDLVANQQPREEVRVLLSSVSGSSKFIDPNEGVVGTSHLSLVSQEQVTARPCGWLLKLGVEGWGGLVGLSP